MLNSQQKRIARVILILNIFVFGLSFTYSDLYAATITGNEVVSLVNKARQANGVALLSRSKVLDQTAKDKANDMLKNDYFAHTSPDGVDPWFWFSKEGYDYKYAGENLAINYTDAKQQNQAWMKSDSHRKNILNGNYKETGVAVVEGKINGENSILTVQVFGAKVVAIAEAKKTALPEKSPEVAGVEKLPEVFSAEKIIAESPSVASAPIDFVSKQKVAQQIQPIKNFLDSNTFTIQIVLLAALLSSLLAIKLVKMHKIYAALENKEKQELAAAAIAHTEYAGLWRRMELHWHKNRNDHSTEIRPG